MTDKDEIKTEQETADTACCEENTDKEAELKDTEEAADEQDAADEAEADKTKDGAEEAGDNAKPDKKDKQIEELNDKYKRLFAEFDNFRKRTDAEKAGMFIEGERTVLLKVLPLIDNFERAIASIPEEQKETALAEGIDKTYKSFMSQLAELGVTPIDAAGKPFDANLHNAVMHIEDEETDENTVVEEFQKGYMFKDKVLRYSMVKVAN
ncbi:MAG: nucleotide exchange factor GrpE [Eubacteriales bacterium]|nr:nucleotide exchange factor GrpE [Eubacteriales bacterium]